MEKTWLEASTSDPGAGIFQDEVLVLWRDPPVFSSVLKQRSLLSPRTFLKVDAPYHKARVLSTCTNSLHVWRYFLKAQKSPWAIELL